MTDRRAACRMLVAGCIFTRSEVLSRAAGYLFVFDTRSQCRDNLSRAGSRRAFGLTSTSFIARLSLQS